MKKIILQLSILLFLCIPIFSQETDTLTILSKAFGEERQAYVIKPSFYKYQSDKVKRPVIFLLDGQHEWLANPLSNQIEYLQYTKDIPQALVVIIPLKNRVKECAIQSFEDPVLPLHQFITQELWTAIQGYSPGEFKLLIGHSFSASFALYSYSKSPDFYASIIAHSPLDELTKLISKLCTQLPYAKDQIYISYGGVHMLEDGYHFERFKKVKAGMPDSCFQKFHFYHAKNAKHNSLPIVATPIFLSQLFDTYSYRNKDLARVDLNYKLINQPASVEEEIKKMQALTQINGYDFPIELPEYFGIASRYLNSEYTQHGIAVYEKAIEHFPYCYEFYTELATCIFNEQPKRAQKLLQDALPLIELYESDLTLSEKEILYKEIKAAITELKNK